MKPTTKITSIYNKYRNWEEKLGRDYFDDPNKAIKLVTHAGTFHSDDVMATVVLRYLFNSIKVPTQLIRTNTPKDLGYTDDTEDCIVYDIGLGQYDHHQTGEAAMHCLRTDRIEDENGVHVEARKYAAVGLIWKEVGEIFVGKFAGQMYDAVIKGIDDHDNGFASNPLSMLIKFCNPKEADASMEAFDLRFNIFSKYASNFFNEAVEHYRYLISCESILRKLGEKNAPYLVSDVFYPGADDICRELNIPFFIYPSQRGGWAFKTIGKTPTDMKNHLMEIPDEVRTWEGVTFLHPSCFLGSAKTKERAIEIVQTIVNWNAVGEEDPNPCCGNA